MRPSSKHMAALAVAIMTVVCITAFVPAGSDAQAVDSDTSWYNGSGAEFSISTEAQLRGLATIVNGGDDLEGVTINLASNIFLSDKNWTPIGEGVRTKGTITAESTPFRGTFDGQNHTISGLTIKLTAENGDAAYGLFGVVAGGTVENLTLLKVNMEVSGSEMAGAVAGMVTQDGTIFNCGVGAEPGSPSGSNDGSTVKSNRGNGGIVGRMTVSGSITDCYNYANVTALTNGGNTGGIVGAAYYENQDMIIDGCYNYGTIDSPGSGVGGIVGLNSANVYDCYNYGEVKGNGTSIGGIVGEARAGAYLQDCHNSGYVGNNQAYVNKDITGYGTGGIVGWIRYVDTNYYGTARVSVVGCINDGDVSAQSIGAGGIVGMLYHGGVVTGCTSSGNITGENMVAGIVGGVQTTDDNHSDDCRVVITNNTVAGGTLTLDEGQPNIGAITGHLVDAIIDQDTKEKCPKLANESRATVVDNNSELDSDIDMIGGSWTNKVVAKIDGGYYGYSKLADALNGHGATTITLLTDVTESVTVSQDVTIDLGEHTLSGTVTIGSGAVLTMTGAGKFTGTFTGSTAENLTITGGTYSVAYLDNRDTTLNYSSNSDGTFTVTSEFTVTFVIDGEEIERTVAYGGTVSGVPSLPSDPGYTYAWTVGGEEWDPSVPVTGNFTVTAMVTGQVVDPISGTVEIHIEGTDFNKSSASVKIWWGTYRLILDQDYTLTEGSIVVTLTDSFLDRLRAEGDSAQSLSIQYIQDDVKHKVTYGLEVGSDDQTSEVTPPTYDDDELPPFIPSQTEGNDDTVTIVACAAAAAVAAIMTVFLIIDRKK